MTVSFIIDYLRKVFTSLPPLPRTVSQTIVTYTPAVICIAAVLNLVVVVLEFIEGTPSVSLLLTTFYVSSLVSVIFSIILFAAVKPLMRSHINGWRMLVYLNSLFTILSILMFGLDNLLIAVLVYYVLFQIEPYYT